VHPPTRRKLEEFGLLEPLRGVPNLELRGLFDYPEFIDAIARAKFLMTDGGGPQEESHFLGVPCLLLRDETERSHPNVFMPGWDQAKVDWFDEHCQEFRKAAPSLAHSPSDRAVEAMVGPPA
jgi:UDP-N-acetylglucosamine 2-epimerase (non-hydrolysing)